MNNDDNNNFPPAPPVTPPQQNDTFDDMREEGEPLTPSAPPAPSDLPSPAQEKKEGVSDMEVKSGFDQALVNKGDSVNLTQKSPGLRRIRVGVGWDAPEQTGGRHDVDLDACVFLLNPSNQVRFDTDFIFYNNLKTDDESIVHHGDNTTGEGDGDDEVITANLEKLPFDVDKLVFTVTMHNYDEREQSFKIVENAYMRIVNDETGQEIIRYNLQHEAAEVAGFIFGEVARDAVGGGWSFTPMGKPAEKGLYEIAHGYGVNVAEP